MLCVCIKFDIYVFVVFIVFIGTSTKECEDWHFTHVKHLNDHIISLRGEVCAHKTSLTPPLLIEVPVPSQEGERSCICASILPMFL